MLTHESVSLKPIDCDKVIKTTTASKMGVFYSLRERLKNRVILVDVLAALFGMGAWLSVNGVYTQLPLLVFKLPEGWVLPSYMVILIQVCVLYASLADYYLSRFINYIIMSSISLHKAANIGGVGYGMMHHFCKRKVSDSVFISLLMFIGCLSLLLMSFFYG